MPIDSMRIKAIFNDRPKINLIIKAKALEARLS